MSRRNTLNKEYRQLMNQLNKMMNRWDELEVAPHDVRMMQENLHDFYESIGKKPKHDDRFSTRIKLTEEQQEELENIAYSGAMGDIDVEDWNKRLEGLEREVKTTDREINFKAFETLYGQYGIKTYGDFIDFYEQQERMKNEKLISSILSSDQIGKLLYKGEKNKYSEREILDKILEKYKEYNGVTGDDLYEFVYKSLKKKENKKGNK